MSDLSLKKRQHFLGKCEKVSEKFQKAFEMFSMCHNMYDSSFLMSDDDNYRQTRYSLYISHILFYYFILSFW